MTKQMRTEDLLDHATLVVAHPDDEVLWYSSILEKVDRTIICFVTSRAHPEWDAGRQRSLDTYPVKNVSTLGLEQLGVFNRADWHDPRTTQYGLELGNKPGVAQRYEHNFQRLQDALRVRLQGSRNVVTHNPWGEYGHEEHVQVYRAIEGLQRELGFTLWYSNYCSNKSFQLMLRETAALNAAYVTLPTNEILAAQVMNLYRDNGCWTWYEDYEWYAEESFITAAPGGRSGARDGHTFPVNLLQVELPEPPSARVVDQSALSRLKAKLAGAKRRISGHQ